MWFFFACTPSETPKSPVESGVEESSVFQSFSEEVSALKIQNVIVVQPDTLRADRLPFYGSPHDTLPDTAAMPGWAVWEDAISSSSWTFPSVASLLTSSDVHQHGLMDVSQTIPGLAELPMWQRNLGAARVHTGYFNGNSGILLTNMHEGWERAEMGEEYPDNAVAGVAAALSWLDQIPREEPFFMLIQPMDSHAPWHPFPEYLGRWSDPEALPFSVEDSETDQKILLQEAADVADVEEEAALRENMLALYDEEILGMDRAVVNLMEGLEVRGLTQNTLVVFTADHGEGFFEKPATFGHGGSVRQELVRIPLAFYHPSLTTKVIEGCPIGNMDLLPMVGTWV
ncbi:MAG TPA: sulfatase-like hydrolase/transferase, partial [Myxococcota bacterium]|nr:sulfatase-like hydrolase/transferase [Myxococcota bacterium]